MKKIISFLIYLYGMMFFLPVLLTMLFSGGTVQGRLLSGEERCLALLLAAQVPDGLPEEALKAQAVLVRTNFEATEESAAEREEMLVPLTTLCGDKEKLQSFLGRYPRCRTALQSAEEILSVDGEARRVPYHLVNSGRTRDGAEVLRDDSYGYLVSVESPWDCSAPDYAKTVYFPADFGDNLEVVERDSAGYVTEVRAGGQILSGEELRAQLGLPSSAFSFRKADGRLRVLCRGVGHGLGMSQRGACAMADEGSSYIEILNYYFPAMEIS